MAENIPSREPSYPWRKYNREVNWTAARRHLNQYEELLNINRNDLVGKKILDIGSGRGFFAAEAQEYGADVIPAEPYAPLPIESIADADAPVPENQVAAWGEQLPFQENTFDLITSVFSAFYYSPHIDRVLTESIRVLKQGGELRIAPLFRTARPTETSGPTQNQEAIPLMDDPKFKNALEPLIQKGTVSLEYREDKNGDPQTLVIKKL